MYYESFKSAALTPHYSNEERVRKEYSDMQGCEKKKSLDELLGDPDDVWTFSHLILNTHDGSVSRQKESYAKFSIATVMYYYTSVDFIYALRLDVSHLFDIKSQETLSRLLVLSNWSAAIWVSPM